MELIEPTISIEPGGDEAAPTLHEVDLLIGYDDRLQHQDLLFQRLCESSRIDGIVPVRKCIFHTCSGKVVDNGTAHGELVKVIVREMVYDLSHGNNVLMTVAECSLE